MLNGYVDFTIQQVNLAVRPHQVAQALNILQLATLERHLQQVIKDLTHSTFAAASFTRRATASRAVFRASLELGTRKFSGFGTDYLGLPAGQSLPTLNDDIAVHRIKLHAVALAVDLLAGNERGARAAKQIKNSITLLAAVLDALSTEGNRLHGGMLGVTRGFVNMDYTVDLFRIHSLYVVGTQANSLKPDADVDELMPIGIVANLHRIVVWDNR